MAKNINSIVDIEHNKNSLHTIAPYIGKIRPELAEFLVKTYAVPDKIICDPFCGSGTVLLAGWQLGYRVLGIDLNEYAWLLSMAKLYPYSSLDVVLCKLEKYNLVVQSKKQEIDIQKVPEWVKDFFHPETLKEIIAWEKELSAGKEYFLLACLMGILHHQRPGFLSYPSSHGAPYLRKDKYPQDLYPEMYEYRAVYERLIKKVHRTLKSLPVLDYSIERQVKQENVLSVQLPKKIGTIITSPPYMKSLTYARDNRLRLWFLGVSEWEELDKQISPGLIQFEELIENSIQKWASVQERGDYCIIVIGDLEIKYLKERMKIMKFIEMMGIPYYEIIEEFVDPIPEAKKMVKGNEKIKNENIIVMRRK